MAVGRGVWSELGYMFRTALFVFDQLSSGAVNANPSEIETSVYCQILISMPKNIIGGCRFRCLSRNGL